MNVIDLRSDTVTKPTDEMRRAMYEAEVGDDVYGEDPSINRLQERAAEMLGKEAGLLTASGTMSNLVAALTHCQRGDEIVMGDQAHMFWNESAGASALAGAQVRLVPNDDQGRIDPSDLATAIRPRGNVHMPPTTLVCLENTHNRCSGGVLTPEDTKRVADIAHAAGAKVHLDGARIFNAAVSLEVPASELVKDVDDVSFCLSKALSCPVGSVLCGSKEFIEDALKWRKMVGGGMRQAGVLAAAGLVALDSMVERLADDHANARRLAHGLGQHQRPHPRRRQHPEQHSHLRRGRVPGRSRRTHRRPGPRRRQGLLPRPQLHPDGDPPPHLQRGRGRGPGSRVKGGRRTIPERLGCRCNAEVRRRLPCQLKTKIWAPLAGPYTRTKF